MVGVVNEDKSKSILKNKQQKLKTGPKSYETEIKILAKPGLV